MDKNSSQFLHAFVEQEVPASLDLWPAIQAKLEGAQAAPQRPIRNARSRLVRRLLLATCALVVLIWGQVLAIRTTQATISGMLQRFGMLLVDSTPPVPTPADSQQVTEEFRPIPMLSLEEAQRQIAFHIPRPTWLPEGLTLLGAYAMPPGWARLAYSNQREGDRAATLGIEIKQGAGSGGYVFPDSARQDVLVNGQPASYVRGAWTQDMRWNADATLATLSWEADGLTYLLQYSGADISSETLILIAESLR